MSKLPIDEEIERLENIIKTEEEPKEDKVESEPALPEPEKEPVLEPEKEEEPVKSEPEKKIDSPVDHTAIARANFEAREAKRKAAELEAEIEKLKNPPKDIPKAEDDWEGNTSARVETVEQKLARLEKEREEEKAEQNRINLINQAKQEFNNFEDEFKPQAPDYEDARAYLANAIAQSVRILNPNATRDELTKAVEQGFLMRGSYAVNANMNPAAVIYEEAKRIGYIKQEQNKEAEKAKPNMNNIAENRKKTSNMAASPAGSMPAKGINDLINMNNKQRQSLTQADFDKFESELY